MPLSNASGPSCAWEAQNRVPVLITGTKNQKKSQSFLSRFFENQKKSGKMKFRNF